VGLKGACYMDPRGSLIAVFARYERSKCLDRAFYYFVNLSCVFNCYISCIHIDLPFWLCF
jgi:hypothetical protein